MPLNPEIRERLQTAINHAQHPGWCQYVVADKPCCVIGQFGFLSGLTIDQLKNGSEEERTALEKGGGIYVDLNKRNVEGRPIFYNLGAPIDLLSALQQVWDNEARPPAEMLRKKMTIILNDYE